MKNRLLFSVYELNILCLHLIDLQHKPELICIFFPIFCFLNLVCTNLKIIHQYNYKLAKSALKTPISKTKILRRKKNPKAEKTRRFIRFIRHLFRKYVNKCQHQHAN